jgi:hypothetical protein
MVIVVSARGYLGRRPGGSGGGGGSRYREPASAACGRGDEAARHPADDLGGAVDGPIHRGDGGEVDDLDITLQGGWGGRRRRGRGGKAGSGHAAGTDDERRARVGSGESVFSSLFS